MSDFISRQDALKIIDNYIDGSFEWGAMMLKIKRLPTADVKPVVRGEWISHIGYNECNKCNTLLTFESNYCPNCGAEMRGN